MELKKYKIAVKKILAKTFNYNILPNYITKKNFLFIHIPKCAGTSFSHALYNRQIGHMSLEDYFLIDKNFTQNVFKFTICRHPLERLISAYHFLKNGGINKKDLSFSKKYLSDCNSFEDFVLHQLSRKEVLSYYHFRPQSEYISYKGIIRVDKVYKLESINNNIHEISKAIGIEIILNKLNENKKKRIENINYEMLKIITKIYKNDFENFNYNFKA